MLHLIECNVSIWNFGLSTLAGCAWVLADKRIKIKPLKRFIFFDKAEGLGEI
jgi:hypothetical protein